MSSDDIDSQVRPPAPAPLVPPSIALAWGLDVPGSRGPKRGLTLERIVAAAIALADADGLAALSMSRIAAELEVATMSLYRYVAAKDDLLVLMVDAGLGAPPAPAPGEDWRAGLRRWAEGVRDAYRRHPWSLRVPISAPPLAPNNVAWLDSALQALAGTPLAEREKLGAVLVVSGFVRNDTTLTVDMAAGAGDPPTPTYGRLLSTLIDPARFPALDRAIASGSLDDGDDDPDENFEFGLERILDGLAVLMARG